MPFARPAPTGSLRESLVALSALWFVVLGAPDLIAHARYLLTGGLIERLAYAVTLVGSWALFVAVLGALVRVRQRHPRWALALSFVYGAWIGIGVAMAVPYRLRFGQDLPSSYLSFLVQNTAYGWRLFCAETGAPIRWAMGCAALLIAACVVAYARSSRARVASVRATRRLAALGAALLATSLVWKRASLPADFHATRVVVATLRQLRDPGRLPQPTRPVLPAIDAPYRPNVLLLLGESLSADEWAPWSQRDDGVGLARITRREEWVPLLAATAGGSATDISVPSILTGLRSDDSADDFARAPLLWHEARARGYRTGLFSSQDFRWLHLGDFLLGADRPDAVRVLADFPGAPLVNDGAIDDGLAVQAALEFVDAVPEGQPFFLVVQFNVTHFPSWAPGLPAIPTALDARIASSNGRRPLALAYLQTLQQRLLDHLAQKGLLDETLIVCTSDHGVGLRPNAPSRLESHYDDVLRVPLGVHMPRALRESRPDAAAALANNAEQRTSNADIYPTLLDVWGSGPALGASHPRLAGDSLLRPLPDRMVLATSTGPIRSWHRHAFALYHGSYKWLVDEHDGARAFDLANDPGELHDVLASVPAEERDRFAAEVRKSSPLRQLVESTSPELLAR